MMKPYKILFLAMMALLAACSSDEDVFSTNDDALEMKGIRVAIAGEDASITRAATVDPLKVLTMTRLCSPRSSVPIVR